MAERCRLPLPSWTPTHEGARAARAREGRLVPHPHSARLDDVAGLERPKAWPGRRERIVREPEAVRSPSGRRV